MKNPKRKFINFKMILKGIYLLVLCIFSMIVGRYYYNNAYNIYDFEKSKANNYFRKLILKLNTVKMLKIMGFLLMIIGLIGFITIVLSLIQRNL